MYPEKPKRGEAAPAPLDFVTPSPIEGCITILKRQAYDMWGDSVRLHVDSITPDEWVVQVFLRVAPGYSAHDKIIEGRLIADESGGTRVMIGAVPLPINTPVVLILFLVLIGVGGLLVSMRAASLLIWLTVAAAIALPFAGMILFPNGFRLPSHPKARVVLADVDRLLRR